MICGIEERIKRRFAVPTTRIEPSHDLHSDRIRRVLKRLIANCPVNNILLTTAPLEPKHHLCKREPVGLLRAFMLMYGFGVSTIVRL